MAKTPSDIRSLARSHTDSAINVLKSIMLQPKAPEAARVAAANSLLDRGWGKAAQIAELTISDKRAHEMTDNELASIASAGLIAVESKDNNPDSVH